MSALSIAPYYPFRGVTPVQQTFSADRREVLVALQAEEGIWPACSDCGQRSFLVHSYGRRRVRDLDMAGVRVWLDVPQRKVRCANCGVRVEGFDFLTPYRHFTKRFERAVEDLCRALSIKQVAEHFGLSWHTVRGIDERRLRREVGPPCYDGLRFIAVDEIAIHKGHTYLTIVLDLLTGRVVWIGHGRSRKTLAGFFAELRPEQRSSIEAVAVDMSRPFGKAIQTACPRAALVYDFFHVVAKYGREVLEAIRKQQQRRFTGENRKFIKGSRYLLLRTELDREERQRLKALLEVNEPIAVAYMLRDQLKRIWSYKREAYAERALLHWAALAYESGVPALIRFAKSLLRVPDGIINHCRYPIHTGKLEGMNNKIKLHKRQAYGYRDDEYFILKIKGMFLGSLQPNLR